jgi:transcription termination factor NusB
MILQITTDELTTVKNDALGLVLQAILRMFWFELKFKGFV